jgi:hypothetical protein
VAVQVKKKGVQTKRETMKPRALMARSALLMKQVRALLMAMTPALAKRAEG